VTVGFHSPLPPARTGVADYAAALFRGLQQHGEIRVNARTAAIHLYHLGNNQLHRDIYRRALAQPGVVVLHDAVLQHFFLGSLSEAEYVDEFVYNYGEWHRDRGRQLWRDRAGSATDERYFRYAMLRRIAETSKAVVVHNAGASALVRSHAPDADIATIPHLFDPPPPIDPVSAFDFRRKLRIPLDAFVLGVFGYLRESKRLLQILEVLSQIPHVKLLLAGDIISTDLARACEPLLARPGIYRVPYLPERDFWIAASAIDACINLRVPAAGETSGIAVRMMGMRKPVLLTDAPENSALPQGTYLPVPSGVAERAALFDYICILASDRLLTADMGRLASDYIRREHSIARVCELYWDLLCKYSAS